MFRLNLCAMHWLLNTNQKARWNLQNASCKFDMFVVGSFDMNGHESWVICLCVFLRIMKELGQRMLSAMEVGHRVGWPSWPSDWKQIYSDMVFLCVFFEPFRGESTKQRQWESWCNMNHKVMCFECLETFHCFATKLSLFPFGNIARLLKEVGSSNRGVLMHQSKDYKPAYRGQVELGRLLFVSAMMQAML